MEPCAIAERHFTGMVRRAYFLCRFSGQRGSDIIRLGPTMIDEGGFRITPKKTGKRIGDLWIPIEPPLAAAGSSRCPRKCSSATLPHSAIKYLSLPVRHCMD
jgi:integrase